LGFLLGFIGVGCGFWVRLDRGLKGGSNGTNFVEFDRVFVFFCLMCFFFFHMAPCWKIFILYWFLIDFNRSNQYLVFYLVWLDRRLKGGSNGTNFVGFDGVFVFFCCFCAFFKKKNSALRNMRS
jgi:hypothetical protein